jgi:hypothetical protein
VRCLLGFLLAVPAAAIWSPQGTPVPVERVLANTRAQIKANPTDFNAWTILGRLQSYAFFSATSDVRMQNDRLFISDIPAAPRMKHATPDDIARLKDSIAAFRKSISINDKQPIPYLGLGWDLEQGAPYAAQLGESNMASQAVDAYRKAYDLASKTELQMKYFAPGYEAISLEAAQRMIAIHKQHPTAEARAEIDRLEKTIDKLQHTPRAMTPVIFSFRESTPLAGLVSPAVRVSFDLDGLGRDGWSWLQPSTGILVWDPQRTGVVSSGLQLFGNATWWMMWRDGYRALAALDDNRDGWLAGPELAGVAVWVDRNQNGRSDAGEVIPIEAAGIARIRVEAAPGASGVLEAPCGIEFADGRCTPSYDWISVAR